MTTIKPMMRAALLVALTTFAGGCAGDDTTGPTEASIADLAGLWIGTAFSVTSNDSPGLAVNLVEMGGNLSWGIQTSGSFSGTAVLPGALLGTGGTISVPLSGVMRMTDATTLRIDFVPEIPPIFTAFTTTFTLSGNTLTIVDAASTFDFNGDGEGEAATMRAVFSRN